MRRKRLALTFVAALFAAGAWCADSPAPDDVWNDEEFKRAFLGSYGVHPDVEPRIGPGDRVVLEQVYPLLGSDPAQAETLLLAAQTNESSAIFAFVLGNLALQTDRAAEAERHFRDAVRRFPSFRRAWRNLGLLEARDQRNDEAIASFTKMIQLGGGDALSFGLLASAHIAQHDYLAAEAAFRQALLLDPHNAQWRIGLARSVVKQEKHEEAFALLGVLIEREPERSEFWILQAQALLGMGQPLRAAENLEMVSLLGRATSETLTLLGDIYLSEGRPDLASSAYLRSIDLDAAQPAGKPLHAAEQLAARGSMPQADAVAERIRTVLGPRLSLDESGRLDKLEARIASSAGRGDEALELLEGIVARDPLDGDALLLMGQQYTERGETDRAIVYLERAAGIAGYEARARLRQAQLLVSATKYAEALPLLRRAQELEPREQVARYLDQVERLARGSR